MATPFTDPRNGKGWRLRSERIEAEIYALGGRMAPVTFILPDGRKIQPFKISEWADRPEASSLPPVMRHLRGDFACVPFGAPSPPPSAPDTWKALFEANPNFSEIHGVCANHEWEFVADNAASLTIGIDYPHAHPVRRVEKKMSLNESVSTVEVELTIFSRQKDRIAAGVHPVFDIGEEPGGVEIETPFRFGRTFPGDYAPGISRFAQDARFEALTALPLRAGGEADGSRLPLNFATEEVIQLCGVQGRFLLKRRSPSYTVQFTWDAETWPSLLLGIANGGRANAPYDGHWYALYVEAIASAFGIGSTIAANANNPIAQEGVKTWIDLDPDTPWKTHYRFTVTA